VAYNRKFCCASAYLGHAKLTLFQNYDFWKFFKWLKHNFEKVNFSDRARPLHNKRSYYMPQTIPIYHHSSAENDNDGFFIDQDCTLLNILPTHLAKPLARFVCDIKRCIIYRWIQTLSYICTRRTLPQDTSLIERVEHPGLPGVLRHSVKLRTSTPGYIAERACRASRPTWGITSLRQTTDFTPGYIADRACRASRPTWGITSLRQTMNFTTGYIAGTACKASRPTWVIASLRQTTNFTPGYIADTACKASRPTWVIASLLQTTNFTPGYIADRACRE
jgi:hypothetical protein